MDDMITFIPNAGGCITSKNIMSGAGQIRWMVRDESTRKEDNGWRIFSDIDTTEYLNDPSNMVVTDFNYLCNLQPALIGIWDLPVGSDLQIVTESGRIEIVETLTGRVLTEDEFFDPTVKRQG